MAKGVSMKFKSYTETVPKMLELIKFEKELQKHSKIILKPSLKDLGSRNTSALFVEEVLKYCVQHKAPDAKIYVAEGSDGEETHDVFEKEGYHKLAETYAISLVDLNDTEVNQIEDGEFLRFERVMYPKLLLEGFVISLPKLAEDTEIEIQASLSNMLGTFPASHYQGFFSKGKTKIRKWPIKYSIHDILRCKFPEFAIIDASDKGVIIAGIPFEMDKQAAKLLGKDWKSIQHLRLIDENFSPFFTKVAEKDSISAQA